MAKKLTVPIVADSAAFKRGLKESEKAAKEFEAKIKGTTSNVRSHVVGLGAAFIGVGGLTEGILSSVKAAESLNVSTRALNAQLKANGENVAAIHPQVEKLNAQMANLGFTNAETEQAFTRLDRASGSAAASAKYMGVTADFAAAKHIALSQAALIVGKVMDGNTTAMNRYGIAVPKGTSATDALRIAQEKLAGQAAAAVTPQEKFHAVLTNIEAIIGEQLLPTIDHYLDKLSVWFGKSENQKKITDDVKQAVVLLKQAIEILTTAIGYIKAAFEKFSDAVGGSKHAIELLLAAFAAFKTASFLGSIADVATKVGLIGSTATTEAGKVGLLRKALLGLGGPEVLAAVAAVGGAIAAIVFMRQQAKHLSGGAGNFTSNGITYGVGGGRVAGTYTGPGSGVNPLDGVTGNTDRRGRMRGGSAIQNGGAGVTGMSLAGENPHIKQGLDALAAAGYNVNVTSGRRTYAQQAALYARYVASGFNIKYIAAKPGQSNHESGNAVDAYVNGRPVDQSPGALAILKRYGLVADVKGDHEHLDYRGAGSTAPPTAPRTLPGDAIAAAAAAKKAAAAAKAAASAAYKSWKENYFTPLDNQYKSDMLVTDEAKRLNALQALHAKLAIDLKNTTGKEHQDLLNEEDKVQSKIISIKQKQHNAAVALIKAEKAAFVANLQAQQTSLQTEMSAAQAALSKQQSAFDRAWQRISDKVTGAFNTATQSGVDAINAKYGAATPEEQAAAAFQAQLDAAQRAADFAGAQGDPVALQQVTDRYKLQDLQDAATKSRAIADATAAKEVSSYQSARAAELQNLNDWLDDQKTALETGATTWDKFWSAAFSDAPAKYAPDAVSSLQGVINQMQVIANLQAQIDSNSSALANGHGPTVNLPGGITVGAGVLGHGFGGGFAQGGSGIVSRPTWFLAGEGGGQEQYAFSGTGKTFADGGGSGATVILNVGPVYGAIDQPTARQWAAPLKAEIDRIIKL